MKLVASILKTVVATIVVVISVYLLDKFGLVEFIVNNVDVALTKLNPPK